MGVAFKFYYLNTHSYKMQMRVWRYWNLAQDPRHSHSHKVNRTFSTLHSSNISASSTGLVALSLFGQHFFESLSELEAECSRERNSCNKQ